MVGEIDSESEDGGLVIIQEKDGGGSNEGIGGAGGEKWMDTGDKSMVALLEQSLAHSKR